MDLFWNVGSLPRTRQSEGRQRRSPRMPTSTNYGVDTPQVHCRVHVQLHCMATLRNFPESNIPNWHFGAGAVNHRLLAPFCARLGAFDLPKNLRMTRALVSAAFLVRPGVAQARFSSQHGSFWKLERFIFVPPAPSV